MSTIYNNGTEYGGGTTNYNDLSNKPKIGGVELSGNKTISQLGGVQTFNGRSGSVHPMAGDYSAEQVNYDSNQTVKQKIDALVTKEASDIAGQQSLLKDTVGWTGKNLLELTLATITKNGITATVNNGVVSTSGTSEQEWVSFVFNPTVSLKAGRYILSGISDGSPNTYRFTVVGDVVEDFLLYDGEQEFTITADGTISVTLYVRRANVDMSGKVFYPMIRRADITDPTYEPYHESVEVMHEEEIHGVNLFNVNALRDMPSNVGFTKTNTGIRISNTVAGTWRFVSFWITHLPKNTDYIISCNVLITSGKGKILVKDFETQTPIFDVNVEDGETFTRKFNTGNYNSLFLTMYCATETAELGDVTYNNLMIRKATIEDSTYRPYNPKAIQNQLNSITGELTVRNLLKNVHEAITTDGITWTKDADGILTLNGTSTNASYYQFWSSENNREYVDVLDTTKAYILSGNSQVWADQWYVCLFMELNYGNNQSTYFFDNGKGVYIDLAQFSSINFIRIWGRVGYAQHGALTVNNYKIYPMLRLASDPDDTYQPYAMTNRELTEIVQGTVTSNFTWNGSIEKCGRTVMLNFSVATGTSSVAANTQLAAVPFKPKNNVFFFVRSNIDGSIRLAEMNTSGQVAINSALSNGGNLIGSVMYFS